MCPTRLRAHGHGAALALLIAVALAAMEALALDVPPLRGRVNDLAGVLSAGDASQLEQKLAGIETETSNQIVILIVPALAGEPIENYGIEVGRAWALGQKGRNNGVLLLVSIADRQARIEVGYGLEGALTDAQSAYILRNILAPRFRESRYADGLAQAVDAIAAAIAGEYQALPSREPAALPPSAPGVLLVSGFILLIVSQLFGRAQPAASMVTGTLLGLMDAAWLFGAAALAVYLIFGLIGAGAGLVLHLLSQSPLGPGRGGGGMWTGGSRGIGGGLGGFGGFGSGGFGGGGGGFGGGGASGRW